MTFFYQWRNARSIPKSLLVLACSASLDCDNSEAEVLPVSVPSVTMIVKVSFNSDHNERVFPSSVRRLFLVILPTDHKFSLLQKNILKFRVFARTHFCICI